MAPKLGLTRQERNTKEKVRRMQMKSFHSMLAPLVHPQPFKLSGPEVLDHAIRYVKQLKERVEELKRRKDRETNEAKGRSSSSSSRLLPVVDIRSKDNYLEINLKCGLEKNFMLHEVISLLQQEGAQVLSLLYRSNDNTVFYTIFSQAVIPRIGLEVSTIQDRLKELIH